MDSAVEAIVTTDALGHIESANPAAEQLFAWSETELVGRPVGDLIPSFARVRGRRRRVARRALGGAGAHGRGTAEGCLDGPGRRVAHIDVGAWRRDVHRHRARRDRAQASRGPARAPGDARPAHGPREPQAVRRAPRARGLPRRAIAARARGAVHGPRRVQGCERRVRAPGRRPRAVGDRAPPRVGDPARRHRRAPGRRRVRGALREPRLTRRRGEDRDARGPVGRQADPGRRRRRDGDGERRRRDRIAGRVGRLDGRARRRGDVPDRSRTGRRATGSRTRSSGEAAAISRGRRARPCRP